MIYMSFLIGLLLICKGGDWFVDAAANLASSFGIPKYIIGATIVSFATTMPEVIVSVTAAMKGSSVMAIGNAVGSVSANTGIILGISLICLPVWIRREEYLIKNLLYIGCLFLLFISFQDDVFTPADSIILMMAGTLFMIINMKNAVELRKEPETLIIYKKDLLKNLLFFILGASAIIAGSNVLIHASCEIAKQLNISEDIISVTILAMGTSLPEFVTTISAIVKKESSLSVGNIVGANMIDTTFILPVCTMLTGEHLPVGTQMKYVDLPVCLILAGFALVPMLLRKKIKRHDGVIVLLIYFAYLFFITLRKSI